MRAPGSGAAGTGTRRKITGHKPVSSKVSSKKQGSKMATVQPESGTADLSLLGVRIAFHIHDVSRMRRKAYDQLMKPLGITRSQWWVLAYLSRHDGMMQTQLANVLDVGKASIGTLLERLEASALVERRPDATDKRARRVFMRRAAYQLLKELSVEEAKFNEVVLGELTTAEQEEFLRMLSKIKSRLSTFDLSTADVEES